MSSSAVSRPLTRPAKPPRPAWLNPPGPPPLPTRRRALHHPNRYVRETGHYTAVAVSRALRFTDALAGPVGRELAERVADGLTDSWSQVCGAGAFRRGYGQYGQYGQTVSGSP